MGVKIVSRKYKNQFYPTVSDTDWLLGNVGEWQRLELIFEVTVDFIATQSETISIDTTNKIVKLNNGKSWQNYGFDIGDECVLTYLKLVDATNSGTFVETPYSKNITIQNLYGDTMEISEQIDLGGFNIIPTDRGNQKIVDVKIATIKTPEGIKFRYGHIANENYQSANLNSFIDGSITEFSFAGLNSLMAGVVANMNPDGLQSGMAIEKCTIQKVSSSGLNYDSSYIVEALQKQRLNTQKLTNVIKADKRAVTVPMIKLTGTSEYKSVTASYVPADLSFAGAGAYTDAPPSMMFLENSATAGSRVFNIDLKFKLVATNENSNSDKISVVILKYNSSGNYTQRLEVKSWNNASALLNQTLVVDQISSINVGIGEGLLLAVEYYHLAQNSERYIDIVFTQANIYAIQSSGEVSANTFQINCDFLLASFFEQLSDLENRKAPSILYNAGSLTDNFEVIVYPEWNNPNTVIKNNLKHTERLGNTGWFDENFNGLDNDFKIESLIYRDLENNIVSQLDYSKPIIIEAEISGIENLSDQSEFGFGYAWIPINENDYKNKPTSFHKNLLINTCKTFIEGAINLNETNQGNIFQGHSFDNSKMNIESEGGIMFTQIDNNTVKLQARMIPNAEFITLFNSKDDNDRKYLIWVSVANHNLPINFSNRVSLLLDFNDMVKVIPPAGPIDGMANKFLEHPEKKNEAGVDVYYGHIEDDILSRVTFEIEKTKKILSFNFGYEITDTITGENYILENISKNVSNFPADQINITESRGFKFVEGNNKNLIEVSRNESNDSQDKYGYKCFFATKIRWEDWILRTGVPETFFDGTKPNNGMHNNWLDYLRKTVTNKLNFFVGVTFIQNNEVKVHKNTFEISINGYDENLNITTEHNYYRNSDGTLINSGTDLETGKPLGVILNNEKTRIEIIYTNLAGILDIGKMYSSTSLEVYNGAGEMEHRQISSVWTSENDNPLQPIEGQSKLKLFQLTANSVKAVCLVDPSLLPKVEKLKITGRIGCYENNETGDNEGLYEARYEQVYQ